MFHQCILLRRFIFAVYIVGMNEMNEIKIIIVPPGNFSLVNLKVFFNIKLFFPV